MDPICKECLWQKCVFAPKFRVCRGEIKGSVTFFRFYFVRTKNDYPRKQYISFPLVTLKCCFSPGKLGKQIKFLTRSFGSKDQRNPPIFFFQTWSLAHSQNSRMLIALSCSEFAAHLAASHSAHATSSFRDC